MIYRTSLFIFCNLAKDVQKRKKIDFSMTNLSFINPKEKYYYYAPFSGLGAEIVKQNVKNKNRLVRFTVHSVACVTL